jgi:hypothetical protein
MDYSKIYSTCFKNIDYSNDEHIQYSFVIKNIIELNLNQNSIIEIGSGRGQNLLKILNNKDNLKNLKITSVDLDNYHNLDIDEFIKCNLSKKDDIDALLTNKYDILICTDVFEHLDKSFIEDVIKMCSKISTYSIFAIANHSDIWNGIELHTIQENDIWWENLLNKYFILDKKEVHYNGRLYMYVAKTNSQI